MDDPKGWYVFQDNLYGLINFSPSRHDPRQREKLNLNFYFTRLCGASNSFMKAFKAFMKAFKLFEAPQRNVKIKF